MSESFLIRRGGGAAPFVMGAVLAMIDGGLGLRRFEAGCEVEDIICSARWRWRWKWTKRLIWRDATRTRLGDANFAFVLVLNQIHWIFYIYIIKTTECSPRTLFDHSNELSHFLVRTF